MHIQARNFTIFVKDILPFYFKNKNILDVGAGDINGNNQFLFEDCIYQANDVVEVQNITHVSKTKDLPFENNSFDTIISTECFEHDPEWEQSLKKIYEMLKPNGLFCFTCASTNRPEHGTRRTSPSCSYGTIGNLEDMQDYYKNLTQYDINNVLKFKELFSTWDIYYNYISYDLYFIGIKKCETISQNIIFKEYIENGVVNKKFSVLNNQSICLNMIVKNEKHIIKETLDNICSYIDFSYWVISDTGSTDGTQEFIKEYFKEKNIPGELFQDEWRDFAYNRNLAIEHGFNKSDYLFFFDADDLIHGNFKLPDILCKDAYQFKFGENFSYNRICLINNRKKIGKYVGVLHELFNISNPDCSIEKIEGDYHFESRHLGDRSKNPEKYKKDGETLEIAFSNENTDLGLKYRYAYYCGQSYQDGGISKKSIEWYKKFLDLPADNQYKYCACINLGHNYKYINNEESLYYYGLAYKYDNTRIEGITFLMDYYYSKDLHFMVNALWNKFKNYEILNPNDKIFLNTDRYKCFEWYNIVSGFYSEDNNGAYSSCKRSVINNYNIPNVLQNLVFYKQQYDNDNDNVVKRFLFDHIKNYNDIDNFNRYSEFIKSYSIEKYDLLYDYFNSNNIDKSPSYKSSNKILIYTGYMNFLWNDSTLKDSSLGGAEKAVIYLSRCLPKNYKIYIAGDQLEEEIDNIKYVNHSNLQKLLNDNSFHTIIISRYVSFFEEFKNIKCGQLVVSAHDSTGFINFTKNNSVDNILRKNNKDIDYIICLTEWHKNNIIERHDFLKDKIKIINNGINIQDFNKENISLDIKVKNRFIWSSCAYRGLNIILNLWSKMLEVIPDATLEICSYDTFPKNQDDEKMLEIINTHSSITHHGKLNTDELYKLANTSEYWLYTNTFPETSCITAMEMLMCGVICIYYPLAGLNDTIGEYGIKVERGNEIETILNLSKERKTELREKGKEYALSCSWENRAEEWSNMLGLNKKKIAIFNSFPFHYEMFGFILNYAKNNDCKVDIFTNQEYDLGWFNFYKATFNNFNVIDFNNFNGNTNNYSSFFVATDDDPKFKSEWITDNVICLNHYYKIRTPNFRHYLNVANFKDSILEYSYPCYPLINYQDKLQNTNVCIIGGGNIHHKHNIYLINNLYSKQKIKLNIFTRKIYNTNISDIDTNKFDIEFIQDIETIKMIKILKESSYVLINYNNNDDHNTGISCSGSLQLALSTLCKPIIINTANQHFKIENVLEYDIHSHEGINIDEKIDFKAIEQERNKYVDKFDKYLNNIIDKENLFLISYGQLRTFKTNFRNNLLELLPILKNYKNTYIFILLDEKTYVRDKYYNYIENICKEFDIKIGFIETIETSDFDIQEEIDYCNKLLLQKDDDSKEFPNKFVLNLLYRKYKLIELVEQYCLVNKLDVSDILYARLFDCIIKQNIPNDDIYLNIKNTNFKNNIYFSPDTTFIGNYKLIKKTMKFDKIYNSDELWNNEDFFNFSYKFDSILTNNQDTYAPEIQYIANIYFHSINAYNLRYYRPDPNCLDKKLMYEIILDPNRFTNNSNEYSNDFINLNLTAKNIIEITNSIDNKYVKYFSDSGFNDYKQDIGIEHYKLLCAISSQIDNGIIIDIGTHHGNSAIALGYNLYKNINNICNRVLLYTFDIKDFRTDSFKKFINDYSVYYSVENIFNCNIRNKYKNVLLESRLIIIDIDPHNGILEYELYNWLLENNYKGLILFDDIYLRQGHIANGYESTSQSMEIFWNKIPNKYKLDLTHIGHWSGTGLVSFNINNIIELDSINIPKKIFQTWEHSNIEPEFQQIINKWKENNPEYEYIFHDAEQRVEFIQENFEENVLNAYNKIIPGAYKCDLWRYCVLYIYGGFYADIDTLCMGKLNYLTDDNIDFIVPIDLNINQWEGQHNLACGFIGSVPKSPILLNAINRIVFNVENNIIPTSKLDFSGPGLLGRAVNNFLKFEETNSFIGKEGIMNNINFLHFDPNNEYIKDVNTGINILQNKNKNQDIIRLYNNECNKITYFNSWVSVLSPL